MSFANSHWVALGMRDDSRNAPPAVSSGLARDAAAAHPRGIDDAAQILVLIEADEGAHLTLEGDAAFEPLPHPLSQQPLSETAQAALASLGVQPGASTFDAIQAAGRVHPLLYYRVF